jgi:D-aspartate ligase
LRRHGFAKNLLWLKDRRASPGTRQHGRLCAGAGGGRVAQPLTERFLDISGYQGLGSLEFKWDARARRFVIIEPTVGRTDWQEEIATLNGLNLALIAYCDELGLPAPPERAVAAAAWRESFLHLGRGAGVAMACRDGYWRTDDPLPAFAFVLDLAWQSAQRLVSKPLLERRRPPFRRRRIA